ncbi:RNA methyltransferase [Nemania abortiva]|nr:RNA methyltransferase [Nemania abortiva]
MRFPTSSCLLCRHSVLLKASNIQRVVISPSRAASSLSAIHNGLRQSQKSRPQGFKQSSLETARPRRSSEGSQSSHRSRGQDWSPPTFKIKKGKKDITDTGPEAQSRRKRFNDPNNNFGKRSLVYQMKHGELRQKLAELEPRGRSRRSSPDRLSSDDFMKDFNASTEDKTGSAGDRGRSKGSSFPARGERFADPESRTDTRNFDNGRTFSGRGGRFADREPRTETRNFDKRRVFPARDERFANRESRPDTRSFDNGRTFSGRGGRFADRESRSDTRSFDNGRAFPARGGRFTDREPRTSTRNFDDRRVRPADAPFSETRREEFTKAPSFGARRGPSASTSEQGRYQKAGEQNSRREQEPRKADDGPIRIHHTTAASQFLYGRSVVQAALKDSRRQLYKLYIYSGDDRRNLSQDDMLAKLAQQKGVEVVKVPNDGLRMMDKMSGGRPHNGCVLEASSLPQLPLKALGPVSEDPKKPGFQVEMAHQSSEEAKINGTSDFVSYQLPKGRNPFILLLDGILDPGNLGAILRTAAFLGVNGIAITKDSSATLTAVALKASAGASEVATLFSVSSTLDFLTRSKENGWLVYAAVPATKRSKGNSHLTVDRVETYDPLSLQPTVLVIGSEGEGLTKPVRRQADHEVSIPSPAGGFLSVVDSLNVSVATGILCSAFLKKQSSGLIEIEEEPSESENEGDSKLW